ncbi:uncharacterized protein LOC111281558 [Durio zibethinus]|uniref:Uncharacterized protein LOC111281558 n=1 Tax=Durio zibethinus TaxID=66656 RepID=A0A6P5XBM6_DURZI|nr:uncharacterized protein LOC111281558 [Durio zibethinus]
MRTTLDSATRGANMSKTPEEANKLIEEIAITNTNEAWREIILDPNKRIRLNFNDWYYNLKLVLRQEKMLYARDEPVPSEPDARVDDTVWQVYETHNDHADQASCIMVASMTSKLQRQHEIMNAPIIILHLKELFTKQGQIERFETSKELFQIVMFKSTSVKVHCLKMIN